MTTTVENLKNEISDCYIKDLKQELGWFKSIAVLPIEKPIKDILVGKGEMPEKFDDVKEFGRWKDIINFVSPEVATRIFDFMKAKRLEIEQRKTESELTQLKNQILGLESLHEEVVGNTNTGNHPEIYNENIGNSNDGSVSNGNMSVAENGEGRENTPQAENSQKSEGKNGIAAGIETAAVGGAGTLGLQRVANNIDNAKIAEQLDAKKIRSTIDGAIEAMKKQRSALESRLTTKQIQTIDKHISKLESGMSNIDGTSIDILKEWNKIGDKLNIPRNLLEECGLAPKQLSKITDMADDLVGKSEQEIKILLESKGIKSIDDNIVKSLSKAANPDEIRSMVKVLRHGSKMNRMLQTIAGALWIDVAFTGFDVWMYIEQKKEAELISKINEARGKNKNVQAMTQLGIGLSSVAIEALAIVILCATTGSAGGPIGTVIGLAVGILTTVASMSVDALYFDVADFYLQNKEDFLRQKRSAVKQAILQGIHNKQRGNSSINEHIHNYIDGMKWFEVAARLTSPMIGTAVSTLHGSNEKLKNQKEVSLGDACWSMIFLEEIDEGGVFAYNNLLREYVQSGQSKEDFLSDKDQNYKSEFEEIWKDMENRVNTRMKFLAQELEKPDIIESLDNGTGMQDLTTIVTKSKAFAELQESGWNDSISFDENLQNYKADLLSRFPIEKIQKLEDLSQNNPSLFQEILTTVSLDAFIGGDDSSEENKDNNYIQNVEMVVAYKKRIDLNQNIEDKHYLYMDDNHKNARFIENLLKVDFDLSKVEYPTLDAQTVIDLVGLDLERRGLTDISDDPLQNVLYRLSRELYGYSGENDIQGLMGFLSQMNDNNHGIYYSSKRKLNKDWAIDKTLKNTINKEFHDTEIDAVVSEFMSKNRSIGKSSIDTPTEAIDDKLNQEFKNKVQSILREELSYRTIEHKDEIKNQIMDFVKQHSKGGEYIELPYFLVLEAKRAGFGDLQRQFFKRENNTIEVCCLPSELNQFDLFDNIEKSYISPAREFFTEEEQYYIDRVEMARTKIEKLRSKTGDMSLFTGGEDELDFPIEIEHLMSEKSQERDMFKENMLMYNENIAAGSKAYKNYEEYATYFENLYKGILTTLIGFKASNDIDSFALFSQCLGYGSQDLFDESGSLLTIEGNKILNDQRFQEFYDKQINELKIGGKTIRELWSSDDKDEKSLAKQASNMIYTTVLEFQLIKFSKEGDVKSIGIKDNTKKLKSHEKDIISSITNSLKQMQVGPTIMSNKIGDLLQEQKIKKLNDNEKKVTSTTPEIQEKIEGTIKSVDWRYKRGQIRFDPETSSLKSWDKETKIFFKEDGNEDILYLDELDLELSLKEGLRLANFKNYVKSEYPNKKVEFGVDIINKREALGIMGGGGILGGYIVLNSRRKTLKINGTMLLNRSDLERYCSVCKTDDVVEKIADWLNK